MFLGWYGLKAFRRMMVPEAMAVTAQGGITLGRALGTTAAFTFLNPHVYLDTVLLMGAAGMAQPAASRPIFVLGAASASMGWFATLGYAARLLTPLFARPSAWRVLDAIVGSVMLTLAVSLIARAFP
ncbi:LysE family transporter [Sphingomonadaceae bacterium jetA1]|uniref:LysE/ArgO family amino acid transporter n=1 Tax=Facivitalis istanbulensis TaxID=3075838 RepID=UPI0034853AB0